MPVYLHPYLRDGAVLVADGTILLGTCPLTPIEEAGREARRIIRRGMADVLRWAGQPVDMEPSAVEVLAAWLPTEYEPRHRADGPAR